MKGIYSKSPLRLILLLTVSISYFSCKSKKELNSSSKNDSSNQLQTKYATLLNVDRANIKNVPLYQFIDEWYGTPYKYGGKTKDGIDCSDFTVILFKNVYNKTLEVPSSKIFSMTNSIKLEEIREGDLVFFKIESKQVSHVGVYLQNNKFVHASTKKGVIISDMNEPYYKKYFYTAGRIK